MACNTNFKAFSYARSICRRGVRDGLCLKHFSRLCQMQCTRCLVVANPNVNLRAALRAQILIRATRMLGGLAPGRILHIGVVIVSAVHQVEVNLATEQVEGGDCFLNLRRQVLVFLG